MNSRMKSKSKLDEAAEKLADIFEKHIAALSPAERAARRQALHDSAAKIRTRAKLEEPAQERETRPRVRQRA
jgi:hypothetical protein